MTAAAALVNLEDFDLHAIDQLLSELNKLGRTIVHRKQGHRMSPIGNHIKRSDNATNTDEGRRRVKTRNIMVVLVKIKHKKYRQYGLSDSSFFTTGTNNLSDHLQIDELSYKNIPALFLMEVKVASRSYIMMNESHILILNMMQFFPFFCSWRQYLYFIE